MLSSHLFFCLLCLLPNFAVPCKMVLARPDEWEICLHHFSLRLFMMVRSSRGLIACWILAQTSMLVTLSLYEMQSPWPHLHVVGMLQFMSDINKLSLPTPFYSVLMSISVFMALSPAFHSINSSDNSPFSHSVLLVLSLPYWSFQLYMYLCMKVSLCPDVIPRLVTDWAHDWAQNTN